MSVATGHPEVQACVSLDDCGPLQMIWESEVMQYNDVTQQWVPLYGDIKSGMVFWDMFFIAVIFGVPIIWELANYLTKFFELIDRGKKEFRTQQLISN